MKTTRFIYLLISTLAVSFVSTGCKHKPVDVTTLPGRRPPPPGIGGPTGLPPGERLQGGEQPFGGGPLPDDLNDLSKFDQDRAALSAQTVHFDFDSSVVKASERPNVEGVAIFMKNNAGLALLIEGHCDERGTEEYNRSLGERRALAIREMLVLQLAVDANRVTTRSFGEDRPADPGHDESAWRQNRRGEFVVLRPK